jgi:hypothetical protein
MGDLLDENLQTGSTIGGFPVRVLAPIGDDILPQGEGFHPDPRIEHRAREGTGGGASAPQRRKYPPALPRA